MGHHFELTAQKLNNNELKLWAAEDKRGSTGNFWSWQTYWVQLFCLLLSWQRGKCVESEPNCQVFWIWLHRLVSDGCPFQGTPRMDRGGSPGASICSRSCSSRWTIPESSCSASIARHQHKVASSILIFWWHLKDGDLIWRLAAELVRPRGPSRYFPVRRRGCVTSAVRSSSSFVGETDFSVIGD